MVHTAEVAGANVHGLDAVDRLIRKDDEFVNADAGYTGIEKRKEIQKDNHLAGVDYRINRRKGAGRKRDTKVYKDPTGHPGYIGQPDWDRHIEYMKSKVWCRAGHVFAVVKGKFGYRKAVYRGLKKNKARLYMLFCSANLLRRTWMTAPASA
jgi:IS5 family transposase